MQRGNPSARQRNTSHHFITIAQPPRAPPPHLITPLKHLERNTARNNTRDKTPNQPSTSRSPSPAGSPASGTETARKAAACSLRCRIPTKSRLWTCCRKWMKRKRRWTTWWLECGRTRWLGCSRALQTRVVGRWELEARGGLGQVSWGCSDCLDGLNAVRLPLVVLANAAFDTGLLRKETLILLVKSIAVVPSSKSLGYLYCYRLRAPSASLYTASPHYSPQR